jgi:hypothetical protein
MAYDMFSRPLAVDGHCFYCHKAATFHRTTAVAVGLLDQLVQDSEGIAFEIACARDQHHKILFVLKLKDGLVQKIGQYPSLADIANDESRTYRTVLDKEDSAELHRAIGLAANGVGIGSFVYLRRVFERLINRRFEELRVRESWNDADFMAKRMAEKVEFLKDHLPDFLVQNKKMYAILSKGIHELEEDECLAAFEMLKNAIFFILDEDKHKREQLELRIKAEKAIASFQPEKRSK